MSRVDSFFFSFGLVVWGQLSGLLMSLLVGFERNRSKSSDQLSVLVSRFVIELLSKVFVILLVFLPMFQFTKTGVNATFDFCMQYSEFYDQAVGLVVGALMSEAAI